MGILQQRAQLQNVFSLKSAEQLESEFNAHIGENWIKREKAEKLRIRNER